MWSVHVTLICLSWQIFTSYVVGFAEPMRSLNTLNWLWPKHSGFSQLHNCIPYVYNFFICLQDMMLVNVKLNVSGYISSLHTSLITAFHSLPWEYSITICLRHKCFSKIREANCGRLCRLPYAHWDLIGPESVVWQNSSVQGGIIRAFRLEPYSIRSGNIV